jgi:CHAT domain-containing protein
MLQEEKDSFKAYYSIATQKKSKRQFDSAIYFFQKSLRLCQSSKDKNLKIKCLLNLVASYSANGITDSAEHFLQKAEVLTSDSSFWSEQRKKEYYFLKGHLFYTNNNPEEAEKHLNKALEFQESSSPDSLITLIYKDLGNVSYIQFNYDKAEDYYNQAMSYETQRSTPDELLISSLYQNLSIIYAKKFQHDKANRYFHKTIELKERLLQGNDIALIKAYLNYSVFLNQVEKYEIALNFIDKAEKLASLKYKYQNQLLTHIYTNKASVLINLARFEHSLIYNEKALRNYKKMRSDENGLGICLINLALYYYNNKEYENVIKYLNKISTKKSKDPFLQVLPKLLIAQAYEAMEQYQKADSMYCKTLFLVDSVNLLNPRFKARINSSYGRFLTRRNKLEKAKFYLKESINAHNENKSFPIIDKVITINNLASFFLISNNIDSALFYYNYNIRNFICDSNSFKNMCDFSDYSFYNIEYIKSFEGKAISKLLELKKTSKHEDEYLKNLFEISNCLQFALNLAEKKKIRDQNTVSMFNVYDSKETLFELAIYIENLLYLKTKEIRHLIKAYENIEKSKSSNLRIGFNSLNALKYSETPQDLLEQETNLKALLKYYDQIISISEIRSRTAHNNYLSIYKDLRFKTQWQYDTLIKYIELKFPKYYSLKYNPNVISVDEIKEELDMNQALLNYSISDSILFIGIVVKDDFMICKVADTNIMIYSKKLFQLIKTGGNKKEITTISHKLYNYLIKPVLPYIADKKKLIIIPDGALYYVPFEFLIKNKPVNNRNINFSEIEYLINDYSISYHYSATLWASTSTEEIKTDSLWKPRFLGIAPTFKPDNPQPDFNRSNNSFQNESVTLRSHKWRGGYSDLPNARKEVINISRLFERFGCETTLLLDSLATEKNLKRLIKDREYIHIATHGFSNDSKPELSGIALYSSNYQDSIYLKNSSFTYQSNLNLLLEESNDNTLYAGEMFNLNLSADLMVLSACESGVGKVVKGEGMIALTRGLVYSGAKNILYTLWKISDKHTERFMLEFYSHILKGKSYPEALRQAKLFMLQNEATAFPKLWTGYMLLGH